MRIRTLLSLAAAGLSLAGCTGGEAAQGDAPAADAPAAAEAAATGRVVEVKMVTDDKGNYFEPKDVTVKPGDVVRFVLASGVHNVSFPDDKNAGAAALPESSPYLQLPGQTHDLAVTLPPGTYSFHCDPHAALGMVGTLTVE